MRRVRPSGFDMKGSCFAALQAFADAAICTTHVTQKQKTIACGNDVANG